MSKFIERLKELMEDNGLKPLGLAEKMGVNRNTITNYLSSARRPSFKNFVKLLDIFNCSADFLLGLVAFETTDVVYHTVPPFCQRFHSIMKEYGMTQYALHQKTNFSYDNFRKWLDGAAEPYADSLERLAQAFDCSVDYLIGRVS
ncbi:MAG: helix-turn-helix domain-containing protein [Clostridia bacterium]|nr:helix-turn-helix domain-containing protein [Clostridia bacterium]